LSLDERPQCRSPFSFVAWLLRRRTTRMQAAQECSTLTNLALSITGSSQLDQTAPVLRAWAQATVPYSQYVGCVYCGLVAHFEFSNSMTDESHPLKNCGGTAFVTASRGDERR
jgi:hypothetical protein